MNTKRWWLVGLAVVILLAATLMFRPGGAAAQNMGGVTVPYTGKLTTDAGDAVSDGAYTLQFSLYAEAEGGDALWMEMHKDVTVTGGAFAVVLGSINPLPKEMLGGATRWLELGVRGPADVDMVTLTPRQQISPAPQGNNPAVAATCAHDHMLENWTGTSSSFGLSVTNYGTGDGIRGENYSPISNYAGVYGVNYSTGPGVYGSGYGGGPGVAGYSDGRGVYGWGADGVVGESSTDNMSGVYGNNLSTGSGYGVTGRSANGFGVFAWGNDNSLLDLKGDILLQGILGEIFATGSAMDLYTNDDMYIDLDNDNNTPYSSFEILRGDDYALWTIMEPSGDVVALGSQASVMQTTDQGQRLMYSVMGTGVWLEDVGSAALGGGGEMFIAFDAVYAQAAMLTADYQVFVTAISDQPVLLYVSAKTPAGFTVKGVTLDGKPAACAFDYRVVAPRAGYEGVRTEPYVSPEKEQP